MNTNPLVYVHPANFYVSLPNWIVSFTIPAFLCRFILRYSLIGWMNAWRVLTLRLGSRRLCELAEVDNILWIFYFSELGFNICSLTMDEYNDKSSSSFEVRNFRDRANEKKKKMVSLGFNTILFLYKRLNFQRCQASRNLFHHFSLLFFPSFPLAFSAWRSLADCTIRNCAKSREYHAAVTLVYPCVCSYFN